MSEVLERKLKEMWKELQDVPVDDDGNITIDFRQWGIGTSKDSIKQWINDKHPKGLVTLINEVKKEQEEGE